MYLQNPQCSPCIYLPTIILTPSPNSFILYSFQGVYIQYLPTLLGHGGNKMDQLKLALRWNRVDIAENKIFTPGTDWPVSISSFAFALCLLPSLHEITHSTDRLLCENKKGSVLCTIGPHRECIHV